MGFLRPKSPPPPPPIPEAPEPLPEAPIPPGVPETGKPVGSPVETTLDTSEMDQELIAGKKKRQGRKSTILTSSLGLSEPATVRRRTLLG